MARSSALTILASAQELDVPGGCYGNGLVVGTFWQAWHQGKLQI